jgi:hypothetical protein
MWGAEPYSIEAAQLRAADLPQTIAAVLQKQGVRVSTYSNGLKISICEIFWASMVSTADRPPGRRIYDGLEPGSLLGVIRYLPDAGDEYREDSHDQKLKPGYYTMRYTILADSDAQDFVLLSPATVDRESKLVLPNDQLASQGRLASGTDQPALLRLVPTEENNYDLSSVRMDEGGGCILQAKLRAKSETDPPYDLTLALILVNQLPEGDGS